MPDFAFIHKPGVPMTANGVVYGDDCETGVEVSLGVPLSFSSGAAWLSVQGTNPVAYPIPFKITVDPAKLPQAGAGVPAVGVYNASFVCGVLNASDTCVPSPPLLTYTVEVTVKRGGGFKPRK